MKTSISIIFFVLFTCFTATVWGQYHYINDHAASLLSFEGKGDLKMSLFFPTGAQSNIQIGYSPIKYLSIIGGYHGYKETYQNDEITSTTQDIAQVDSQSKNFTAAIGSYYFFDNSEIGVSPHRYLHKQGLLLSFQAGYSAGTINNDIGFRFSSSLDYQKLYAQLGLAYKFKLGLINFNLKASKLDYTNGVVIGSDDIFRPQINAIKNNIEINSPFKNLETNIQVQLGIQQAKIVTGLSVNFPFVIDDAQPLSINPSGYIGLIIDLDKIPGLFLKKETH